MSSWYSNLLTKTSSQISSLRSTLLSSEADGDTEDDTHVCRVLRNYYAEKGRPLPPWLPADPKAAAAQVPQTLYAQPQVGARYGNMGGSQQQQGASGGGLSSLWDNNAAQGQQQQQQPQSLRAGRSGAGGGGMQQQQYQQQQQQLPQRGGRDDLQARPVANQRAGSYQSNNSQVQGAPGGAAGSTAQDRLKQRLWGSRTTSPSQGGQGQFQPPPAQQQQPQQQQYQQQSQQYQQQPQSSGGGGNVGRGGGYSGGGNYEDRFAPGGSYDNGRSDRNGSGDGYGAGGYGGGGGGGGGNRPYVGANAPWSTDGDDFMGGGGGGGRQGLPSGPRRQGLPSGPRGYR